MGKRTTPTPRASRRTLAMSAALERFRSATPAPVAAAPAPAPRAVAVIPRARAMGYTGARGDRRELSDWWPGAGSPDADTLRDLPALRGRVRDLERNEALVAGAHSTLTTKTIGVGLVPQPRVDRVALGLSDADADAWERRAKSVFWQVAGTIDLARRVTLFDLMATAFRTELASGDVLVVRRYVKRPGDLLGLKIQLVEADRICNPDNQQDTDRLVAGVEFDADGAVTRYHVRQGHPGDDWFKALPKSRQWTAVPAFGRDSGERLALLVFHQLRAEQTRGVPLASPAILLLKQLTRYSEAEIMAAVVSACFTVIEIPPAPAIDPATQLPAAYGLQSAPTELMADANGGVGYVAPTTPESQVRIDAGAVVTAQPGSTIEFANPTRPNANYEPFFTAICRQLGPALDMPFEVLVQHFSSSYSASRAALLELWEKIAVRRARFVRLCAQPVYEWILSEAVATGILDAPGFFDDPLRRAAWCAAEWVGPAPGQLDEVKAATAAKLRIDAGLSTIERESQQLNGSDWEENHPQQVKEQTARRRDGLLDIPSLPPPSVPVDPSTGDAPEGEPEDAPGELAGVSA